MKNMNNDAAAESVNVYFDAIRRTITVLPVEQPKPLFIPPPECVEVSEVDDTTADTSITSLLISHSEELRSLVNRVTKLEKIIGGNDY